MIARTPNTTLPRQALRGSLGVSRYRAERRVLSVGYGGEQSCLGHDWRGDTGSKNQGETRRGAAAQMSCEAMTSQAKSLSGAFGLIPVVDPTRWRPRMR